MIVQAVAQLSWHGGKDPESMVLVSTSVPRVKSEWDGNLGRKP